MKSVIHTLSTLLLFVVFFANIGTAQSLSQGNGNLRVMTYNVDEGTDFVEIESATTTEQFLVAVGQTITNVRATNPPACMYAVAQQIIADAPTLVSLQEVDRWSSGPFNPLTGTCGALTVEFDMLQELMAALAALGGHYQVAVQAVQYNFPPTPGLVLPSTFLCVQVVDYNVILARTDLSRTRFQWNNPQFGQFANMLSLTTPLGTSRSMRHSMTRLSVSLGPILNQLIPRFVNCKAASCAPDQRTHLCL